jgi:hypothetical protein
VLRGASAARAVPPPPPFCTACIDALTHKHTLHTHPLLYAFADGSLPGGLTPELMQKMMANPDLMVMLQNPKMQVCAVDRGLLLKYSARGKMRYFFTV